MAHNHPHPSPLPPAGEGEKPAHADAFPKVGEGEKPARAGSLSRWRERAGVRVQNARALRASGTDAEQALWRHLRSRQLNGHKFRRQHPIGPYIADFACVEARLVVELDGGQHAQADALKHDERRTQFLLARGWHVLRFWNHDMLAEPAGVLQAIVQALAHPHPHPLPPAGEGVEQPWARA